MKSLEEYIKETARQQAFPVSGDVVECNINEELAVDLAVLEHTDDGIVVEMDAVAQYILEHCGCSFEEDVELDEAEYQGRDVELNKPMRGDVKKFKVYVRDPKTGNVKKVNFGSKEMEIKRDDPARRRSFRARHKCADKTLKKDGTTASYWSCRMWTSKPVSKILKGK